MEPVSMSKPAPVVKPMEVLIAGKIVSKRKHQNKVYTVVVSPAPDAYSHPSFVEVRSNNSFGDKDEEGKWTCRVGGYMGRRYKYVDKTTGEERNGQELNLTLDLVES